MPQSLTLPRNELLVRFESLGDNCEFGLVQRAGGAEPLGLFRFAGMYIPIEQRLERTAVALDEDLHRLGEAGTVTVFPAGNAANREFMVKESVYELLYHSGIHEAQSAADALLKREMVRLSFLRRKLLDDLHQTEKIWVWRSHVTTEASQLAPLLRSLNRFGPNRLLWVVQADDAHPPGSVELIDTRVAKGHVARFAPYDNAPDISPESWFTVCENAFRLLNVARTTTTAEPDPTRLPDPEPVRAQPAPARQEHTDSAPRVTTAWDILRAPDTAAPTQAPAPALAAAPARSAPPAPQAPPAPVGLVAKLASWLGMR